MFPTNGVPLAELCKMRCGGWIEKGMGEGVGRMQKEPCEQCPDLSLEVTWYLTSG